MWAKAIEQPRARRQFQLWGPSRLLTALALVVAIQGCKCGPPPVPPPPVPSCEGLDASVSIELATSAYPSAPLAQDVLRTDISTQGLPFPDVYAPRLRATTDRHRVGEVLMQIGFILRQMEEEASGDYRSQVARRVAPITTFVDSVVAAGGRVRFQVHCSTPAWLATHPYSHSILTGVDQPSDEPVSGCSAPRDLAAWSAIMRGVGEHFSSYGDRVSFSVGSEPESYFAGTLNELFGWYAASARGLRAAAGTNYRIGGLTTVGHKHAKLNNTAPTLQPGNTVTFTPVTFPEPIIKQWIEYCARESLPLDMVTLHLFGGSPVPEVGTYWRHIRRDVSTWLEANGYSASQVEVVVEDWPQWAPYSSNDTEYFAAHTASGVVSMLDLSLSEGAPVRPLQGFLFDYGFIPKGDAPAGFAGRAGLSNGKGVIKAVFNVNSLLREVEGTLTPVTSNDPFVHAIGGTSSNAATLLVVHQVPLEYQLDLLYNTYEQRPFTENHFVAEDLSTLSYDQRDVVRVFFKGVDPGWPALIDAFLSEPSPIDLDQLTWPPAIKAQWEEMRRVGRLARDRRTRCTPALVSFGALPDGRYRLEHFIVDGQHANPYIDRDALDARINAAQRAGRLVEEISKINAEYDAASGKQADREIVITQPRAPVVLDLQPNSVHVLRMTALP